MAQNFNLFNVLIISTTLFVPIFGDQNDLDLGNYFDRINAKIPDSVDIQENFKKSVKEKCDKVSGAENAYTALESAVVDFKGCITELINLEELQNEIVAAKPKGELDTVFIKYCRKRNIAFDCVQNLTKVVEQCLEPNEIDNLQTFVDLFKNLLNFVCFNDGTHIALFIAENGPQCFEQQRDNLMGCVNATFAQNVSNTTDIYPVSATIPRILPSVEQCNELNALKSCVVRHLDNCENSTPANLVASMFKFAQNRPPCKN